MKLSFVIPAHNEEAIIGKCLDAIIRETKGRSDTEIIVVDNASTDGTAKIASSYPGVNVVHEPQKGLVWARRAGYLASHGELIANIDSDNMLTPGWINTVMAEFERDPKLVTLSGPFTYYDLPRTAQLVTRFFYYITYITYILSRFIFHIGSVVQGGNFVVRRTALEKIGGFDTTISFYGEDTDIARRMSKVGNVKFTFALPIYSSGRRLAEEGALTIGLRYTLNYFWVLFFKRPLSKTYTDLRPQENGGALTYQPHNRTREWLLGIAAGMITLAVIALIAYGIYHLVQSKV
jgi:glycosyltransferase involved in cell wall biosynthesis